MRQLRISRSTSQRHGNGNRITAVVGDRPIWFECDTRPLSGVGEGIGSAMFVSALYQDQQIHLDEPVSPLWHQNVLRIAAIMNRWWGISQHVPIAVHRTQDLQATKTGSMLCFSGGVDAFYTLLRGDEKIAHLISAHGYDIGLRNLKHWRCMEPSLQRAASDVGIPLTIIRTNVRTHPLYQAVTWANLNGGALGALAHLMRDHGDRLLVSSSFTRQNETPCGTHWDLDPCWSSEAITIRHFGEDVERGQRLRAIVNEPVVRQNLHVCSERSKNPSGNCSQCPKCLRSMLILDQCDALGNFPVFVLRKPMAELLDDLPGIAPELHPLWRIHIADGLRPDLKAAVERLLRRPMPRPVRRNWLSRTFRGLKKSVRGLGETNASSHNFWQLPANDEIRGFCACTNTPARSVNTTATDSSSR